MTLAHFLDFFLASFAIILVPGPSVLFTVARAVAWGPRIAVLTVVGNAVGMLAIATMVAFGLGPLLARSTLLQQVVEFAGGGYLWWLSVQAFHHRNDVERRADPTKAKPDAWRAVREGAVVGFLNPKSLVFFVAVFPRFLSRHAGPFWLQLEVMGVVFCLLAMVSDGSWGLVAGRARDWFSRDDRRMMRMRVVASVVMATLGSLIVYGATQVH